LGLIDAAQAVTSFSTANSFAANGFLHLGSPCLPGTLSVSGGATLNDDAGKVKSGSTVVGLIDYETGLISFDSTCPTYSGSKTVQFRPAAAPSMQVDTASLKVTAANRGYVWALTLIPFPSPRGLRVSYRALDKWYELYDNGEGGLIADETGVGTGTFGSYSAVTTTTPDGTGGFSVGVTQSADGLLRRLRVRAVRSGATASGWVVATPDVMPDAVEF
jgi:hypothetical protein